MDGVVVCLTGFRDKDRVVGTNAQTTFTYINALYELVLPQEIYIYIPIGLFILEARIHYC